MVWSTWMFICAQNSKICGNGCKMALTDTDSLLVCTERCMSNYEKLIHQILEDSPTRVPYQKTAFSKINSAHSFQAWHSLLDYSSISKHSSLFQNFFHSNTAFETMFTYLAITRRKEVLKWQDECNGQEISCVLSPCPKAYCIQTQNNHSTLLPLQPLSPLPFSYLPSNDPLNRIETTNVYKKTKGIKKAIVKFRMNIHDFTNVVKRDNPPRSLPQYSIKRKLFRLYLITQRRQLVSKVVIKRLEYPQMKKLFSHFNLSLCVKNILQPQNFLS